MASSERTPLIQHVQTTTPRPRYPHSILRRFCTIALGSCLFVAIFLFLVPQRFFHHRHSFKFPQDFPSNPHGISPEELQKIFLETPKEDNLREYSKYHTSGPHLAGKNLSQAIWTRDKWMEFGIDNSYIVSYETYINYPLGHRLGLYKGDKLDFEASLTEDVLEEDPTSGLDDRVPTFHGYSASGNVTGSFVYVNFGTYADFEDLVAANVSLAGKIAVAKYGGVFRGLKVKRAQELGMIGCVLYTDPQEDGNITEENGYEMYPDGPARNPSAVQRGSVQFLSFAPGDPTTPGWPSKPDAPRVDPKGAIPSIPSIPISYTDALPILKSLNGIGPSAADFGKRWQGGGLEYKGVKYNIGPSPDDVTLNLVNEQEYTTTPLWNVIGVINGTLSDEVVVIGNHRDAWIAGGAGDPNSGSAVLLEVIRGFGIALQAGWKPLRTIVIASWDGEEYGLIGSTEWVEEYLPWLSKDGLVYINCDVGTRGPHFTAAASPLLNKAIYEATSLVPSPNQTVPGQTVRDVWSGHIATMGSGSDFTAFQDFAGIPSIDIGFGGSGDDPVYQYHSNYDSFYWMDTFGDPGWHYHATMAKIWGVLVSSIVQKPVAHFNATDYALGMEKYISSVQTTALESETEELASTPPKSFFAPLHAAVADLHAASVSWDAYTSSLEDELHSDIPLWKFWKRLQIWYAIHKANKTYKYLERQFLYAPGLDGRSWFKHVVFAPGLWTGYAGATFPGLVEALEAKDFESAERWKGIILGCLKDATELLL